MILLVWNLIASAQIYFQKNFSEFTEATAKPSASETASSSNKQAYSSTEPDEPLTARQKYLLGKRIDINSASMDDFNSLPGISKAIADAIISERERSGGFRSLDDLLRVKGIKEKRLEKILPFLTISYNN